MQITSLSFNVACIKPSNFIFSIYADIIIKCVKKIQEGIKQNLAIIHIACYPIDYISSLPLIQLTNPYWSFWNSLLILKCLVIW